jgi:hypothetical protein
MSSDSSDAATTLSGLPRQALGCPGGDRDSVKTLSIVPNNVHITFSRGAYRMPFSFDLLFSIPCVFFDAMSSFRRHEVSAARRYDSRLAT